MLRSAYGVLDVLFPRMPPCSLCRGSTAPTSDISVCDGCLERLAAIGSYHCRRCGRPLAQGAGRRSMGVGRRSVKSAGRTIMDSLCHQCRAFPSAVDFARSYGVYEGYLRDRVHALKYRGDLAVAQGLGELMAWTLWRGRAYGRIDLVAPVPLHPSRMRERGYNQALELARVVGWALRIPVDEVVYRSRETAAQSRLPWHERMNNVSRAFAVTHPGRLQGRRVLIVDDVYTTGATVSAVAATLKRAGCRWCAAVCAAAGSMDRDMAGG